MSTTPPATWDGTLSPCPTCHLPAVTAPCSTCRATTPTPAPAPAPFTPAAAATNPKCRQCASPLLLAAPGRSLCARCSKMKAITTRNTPPPPAAPRQRR